MLGSFYLNYQTYFQYTDFLIIFFFFPFKMEPNILIGPPTPSECLGNINLPANYYILKCVDEFRNSVCMVRKYSNRKIIQGRNLSSI